MKSCIPATMLTLLAIGPALAQPAGQPPVEGAPAAVHDEAGRTDPQNAQGKVAEMPVAPVEAQPAPAEAAPERPEPAVEPQSAEPPAAHRAEPQAVQAPATQPAERKRPAAPRTGAAQSAPKATPAPGAGQARPAQEPADGRMAPSRTLGAASDSWTVLQVQGALKQRGYDVGAVDGLIGQKTLAALRRFQEDNKLEASGQIDRETLAALQIRVQPQIAASRYGAASSGWVAGPGTASRGSGDAGMSRGFPTVGNAPYFIPGTPAPAR